MSVDTSPVRGQLVGYARVSSADQHLDRQLEVLSECDRVFTEKLSGKNRSRPALQELVSFVREGDVVLVKSVDRLARSTVDLLQIVEELRQKGVGIRFVDSPELSTDSPQGTFVLTLLAAVAELERVSIRERQAEGVASARRRGVYDRGPKLGRDQIDEARHRLAQGVPKAAVARDLSVSRSTLYDALAGRGRYADSTV